VTLTASAPVLGGPLVVVSGTNTVAPASGSNPAWSGVARQDAAAGESVVVVTRGGVQHLVTSGTVTAADRVTAASGGRVATGTTNVVGTALSTGVDGVQVLVILDR